MLCPYITVNKEAILYNYLHLKCIYKKNIIVILKNDAYGVGAIQIANILKNQEGVIFAVANINEAIELRENDIDNEILVLGVFEDTDIKDIKKYNLQVVIVDSKQIELLENSSIKFHLKINTGMNRLGIDPYEFEDLFNKVYLNKKYNLIGIMTHFATSDIDNTQYDLFISCLEKVKYDNLIIHCFSSNSLKEDKITTHARVGIKLYGVLERGAMLQYALTLYAPIIARYPVKEKQLVGYDYLYTTPSKGYLYILPIGYGQGFGRYKNSYGFINYSFIYQAGNISMDYSTFFSTKEIKKGEMIELIGPNIPLEHIALINNLSPYQILVSLRNINKVYL